MEHESLVPIQTPYRHFPIYGAFVSFTNKNSYLSVVTALERIDIGYMWHCREIRFLVGF